MPKQPLRLKLSSTANGRSSDLAAPSPSREISSVELERQAESWLLDGKIRQLSPATLAARQFLLEKLLWYLRQEEFVSCGKRELQGFLAYVSDGHESEDGRWHNPHMKRKVRPRTVATYHGNLRTFFRWLVTEEVIDESPMERIAVPVARGDQVQPFTQQQFETLLQAARKSKNRVRNEALLLLLYDTGMRASEICGLCRQDLDMNTRRCVVLGKGNKRRNLYFGYRTARALWALLRDHPGDEEWPVFLSDLPIQPGDPLTRWGLTQLIERLGKAAGIEATRCSPHTFRHSFAVTFLRNGGNVFTLKELLGHTTLAMVNKYVALAQADIEAQHRAFSPVDRMKGKRK